jgi:hypothetical protein
MLKNREEFQISLENFPAIGNTVLFSVSLQLPLCFPLASLCLRLNLVALCLYVFRTATELLHPWLQQAPAINFTLASKNFCV